MARHSFLFRHLLPNALHPQLLPERLVLPFVFPYSRPHVSLTRVSRDVIAHPEILLSLLVYKTDEVGLRTVAKLRRPIAV